MKNKTLEKRIAEIEKEASKELSKEIDIPYGNYDDCFWAGMDRGNIYMAKEAFWIIRELQAENKLLREQIRLIKH